MVETVSHPFVWDETIFCTDIFFCSIEISNSDTTFKKKIRKSFEIYGILRIYQAAELGNVLDRM